jgi:GTP-binding protein
VFGFSGKSAYQDYLIINRELAGHSKILAKKPMLVAANKMDLTGSEKKLKELKKHLKRKKVFAVSASSGKGLKELLSEALKKVDSAPEDEEVFEEEVKEYTYEPEFKVNRRSGVFEVTGKKIERIAQMTNFDQEESLWKFQGTLKKMGIEKALEKEGVSEGDIVKIGRLEFTWEK